LIHLFVDPVPIGQSDLLDRRNYAYWSLILPCVPVRNRDVYHVAANVALDLLTIPAEIALQRNVLAHRTTIAGAIDGVNL
jgi:hypothetical protein